MTFKRDLLPNPMEYWTGQGLSISGYGKWRTMSCLFHGGSDSMRTNLETGAWVCMACGKRGGDVLAYHMAAHSLEFIAAARELGAWIDDGSKPAKAAPFSARSGLEVLQAESLIAAVAAGNVANGVILTEADRDRLFIAAARITLITEYYAP